MASWKKDTYFSKMEDLKKREEEYVAFCRQIYYEKSRARSTLEKLFPYLFFSWFFTGPCILFMFIAPSETVGPFMIFGSITLILHILRYVNKKEFKHLSEQYNQLLYELDEIRHQQDRLFRERHNIKWNKNY